MARRNRCGKITNLFQRNSRVCRKERESGKTIYPPQEDVFNAFRYTELPDIKVVILGQDPYHGPGQAHGLSFLYVRVLKRRLHSSICIKSLRKIFLDLFAQNMATCLAGRNKGFYLNTVLTVEQGNAHSHAHLGWETFTDKVIQAINDHTEGVIFLLWGSHAQKKGRIIDTKRHHVLKAPHPSPLSAHRGFLGCGHFSQANQLLEQQGRAPIDWYPVIPE